MIRGCAPAGWLEAEVRWVEGPNAGLEFERSFHPAVFDLLLARLG